MIHPVIPGTSLAIQPERFPDLVDPLSPDAENGMVVLAGGCFWCVEAVYRNLLGVKDVVSGYAGGSPDTANYDAVCTGSTDHAEVVRIEYDPATISYGELLKVFFSVAHDPTQKDQQGNDRGRQYRSAIFYQSEEERAVAEAYIRQLQQAEAFIAPVVTTLEPLDAFYPAEDYHQNFAAHNPRQPYIQNVALPKVAKLKAAFAENIKNKETQ